MSVHQTTADHAETMGVCCPSCGSPDTEVYYTRRRKKGATVRGRICEAPTCGRAFQTRELVIGGTRSTGGTALGELAAITPRVEPPVAIISHGQRR